MNQEKIKINKRRLNWFGHVNQMETRGIVKRIMKIRIYGLMTKWKLRKKWIEQIAEIFGKE